MEIIQSIENSTWKKLKKLTNHKQRKKQNLFLLEGQRLIAEALRSGWPLQTVFLHPEFKLEAELLGKLQEQKVRLVTLAEPLFRQLAETQTPQGIVALAPLPGQRPWRFADNPLLIIVDGVQDPGNLGTIFRTADALGASALWQVKGTVDIFNSKTLRASMGSVFRLPFQAEMEKEEVLAQLAQKKLPLWVGMPEAGNVLWQQDLTRPMALLLGSEACGPSPELLAEASPLHIPMPGKTESLNVAMATTIFLYEICRQRSGQYF